MAAAPHAYDDLAAAYADEISLHRRGGLPLGGDRFNNRHPSLVDLEEGSYTDGGIVPNIRVPELPSDLSPAYYSSTERVRRASQHGGAANKARWAQLKALKGAA